MNQPNYLGVDHVVLRTQDAQLFELLSGPLGLPVTWPLEEAPFATFGWIGVGNTHLEIWAAANNSDLPDDCALPCIQQIALAPADLAYSIARLHAAGVQCKPPRAYQSKNERGELQTNFTNSLILDLSSDACCVFFCDWDSHAPIVPWSKGLTTLERRQLGHEALSACGGGPLGVVGLRQIALQTRSLEASARKWGALTQSAPSPFLIAPNVELHLTGGPRDAIDSLTFAVKDLAPAAAFLLSKSLLGAMQQGIAVLAQSATGGITLRFVQA